MVSTHVEIKKIILNVTFGNHERIFAICSHSQTFTFIRSPWLPGDESWVGPEWDPEWGPDWDPGPDPGCYLELTSLTTCWSPLVFWNIH